MKLKIHFVCDEDGRESAVIVDDRGEQMPCVRSVKVEMATQEVSTVTLVLVVDRVNVTLGQLE